ncbi:MAG: O-antigen ligase domain-containing protein [Candidatus Electrothrix sp. ATG1]|nr:O-antigen ligase domain-containing protein [Candidatus Electrothrix sp. ATG1]MCI5207857.1 O-antigen ligase domain-containing protein [Candidatus Electrothrix sp. ATG2]
MKDKLRLEKTAQYAVLFLIGTIPLLFGAVHPAVTGAYTSLILFSLGGWLLLNSRRVTGTKLFSVGPILFFILIFCIGLSTIPLPISWLEALSPARASFLRSANQLAGVGIQFAPLGYNTHAAVLTASLLIALSLYALTLKILLKADRSFLKKLLLTCASVGMLEAIYGILQATNLHLGVLWLTDMKQAKGMANGTIIYKNQYAALLNMIWPLTVGAALLYFKAVPRKKRPSSKKGRRTTTAEYMANQRLRGFVLLFIASIIMLAVLFTQSRGGILSMIFILSILLIVLPVSSKSKLLLTGFFILFTVSYGSMIGFHSVLDRFMLIHQSGEIRLNIWMSSLPMLRDHLLLGTGIGSYIFLSSIYLKQFPENIAFDRAHNDYLEFAIEMGLPLALFFLCALIFLLYFHIKKIRPYSTMKLYRIRSSAVISLISAAAIIGFILHGIVDFGWRLPANLLYVTTLFTLLQHGTLYSSPLPMKKS